MIPRRTFLKNVSAAGLFSLAAPGVVCAQTAGRDRADQDVSELMTDAVRRAITRGLAYLEGIQNTAGGEEDGSFGDGTFSRNVAVVSLGALAFMAGGSTASRGQYAATVSRALDFVLRNTKESGFIVAEGASSHGPMYGHGFATLFLAEAYGTTRRVELREKLSKAVKLIINTQNKEGGWRYFPQPNDADLSVTVCQIMALRAARNAGLHVPSETAERCIDYVKGCQNADGGFRYMLHGGASAFPRSAAGLVALYSAGIYEGPEVSRAIDYLMEFLPTADRPLSTGHYFYAHYYASQAMWLAGGEYFRKWYPAIRNELVALQRPDGAWSDDVNRAYGTAMATISLQVPKNLLPIFQR